MSRTQCECPLAGWCDRHGMDKTRVQHQLCQSNNRYFQLWERGEGGATKVQEVAQERKAVRERRSRLGQYECVHRSEEPIRHEKCWTCSKRQEPKPVYGCDIHGECMKLPFKIAEGAKMHVCRGCLDRQEPEPANLGRENSR